MFRKEQNPLLLSAAIGIALLLFLYILYLPYLSADAAQYISMAQKVLHGAIPFVSLIDINPPMIIYLSLLPVAFASMAGIGLSTCALLFFYFLVLISGCIFLISLKVAIPEIKQAEINVFFILWILLSIVVYKQREFAQREHLIFLFLSSFIVIRKARYDGRRIPPILAVISAIGAALAFAMKPQYLLPIAAVEGFLLLRSKKFNALFTSPEIYTVLIFGIIYLTHFFLVPGMNAFFDYWLPTISRGYTAYNNDWLVMANILIRFPLSIINLISILLIILVMIAQPKHREPLSIAFILFGIGSLIIYMIQKKGWLYQSLVFQLGSLMGLALFIRYRFRLPTEQAFMDKVSRPFMILIPLLIMSGLTPIGMKPFQSKIFDFPDNDLTETITTLTQPEENILVLSAYVSNMYPWVTYTGRLNAGRFLSSFPIAFFTEKSTTGLLIRDEWLEDEKLYYSALVEDIAKESPRLILIDTTEDIFVYSYLEQRGFFETALQEYICIGNARIFMVYIKPEEGTGLDSSTQSAIMSLYAREDLTPSPGCQLP